jgi:hypothetical protein
LVVGAVGHVEESVGGPADARGFCQAGVGSPAVNLSGGAVAGDGFDEARGADAADRVVAPVGYVDVTRGVDHDPVRVAEAGLGAVAVDVTGGSIPGEGGDDSVGSDLADALAAVLGDVEVALGIAGDAGGLHEPGAGAGSVGEAGLAVADPGADRAVGGDSPDGVVVELGDEEDAGFVDDEVVGEVQARGCLAAVAVTAHAGAGDSGDRTPVGGAEGGDLADAIVAGVGDVDGAGGIEAHAEWVGEATGGSRAIGKALQAAPGEVGDRAQGVDEADPVIVRVGEVEVGVPEDGGAVGDTEGGGAAVGIDVTG